MGSKLTTGAATKYRCVLETTANFKETYVFKKFDQMLLMHFDMLATNVKISILMKNEQRCRQGMKQGIGDCSNPCD
jgi:hypothetical protein